MERNILVFCGEYKEKGILSRHHRASGEKAKGRLFKKECTSEFRILLHMLDTQKRDRYASHFV